MVTCTEMRERSKFAFWTFGVAGAALVCVPSAKLIDAVDQYQRFLTGFEPRPLKPVKMRGTPHRDPRGGDEPGAKLEFSDFLLKAPKAKKVYLVGDFNAWKTGTLPCAKMPDGSWQLTLPLPPGRYKYRFEVDG